MYPLKDCEFLHARSWVRVADRDVMPKPTLGTWRSRRAKRRRRSDCPSSMKTPQTAHGRPPSGVVGSPSQAEDKSSSIRSLGGPKEAWRAIESVPQAESSGNDLSQHSESFVGG